MPEPLHILLIEDNIADARYIEILLQNVVSQKYHIEHKNNFTEGLAILEKGKTDLLLLDLSLPDSYGLETIENANKVVPDLPIIVLTGRNDEDFAVEVVKTGAQDYLVKGEITGPLLSRSIRYAIRRKEMESDLKNINRRLEESELSLSSNNADLLRANKALDRFVYIISHELKKPVANIIGLLSILDSETARLSKRGNEIYEKLKFSAAQLKKMIGDLLAETKKDDGKEINFEMIDLANIFEEVMIGMEQFILESKAKIYLDFSRMPMVPYPYQDLRSIVSNLLSNAIKHRSSNRKSEIHVQSDVEDGVRTLCVTDNGKGIDIARNGDLLFKKYQRFNPESEGTGLGLWIVKEILDKNGSKIEVESHVDKGSMFKIFF